MSYPKKKYTTGSSQVGTAPLPTQSYSRSAVGSNTQKDDKYVKRREQLLQLLVNKFRGKYITSVV